MGLECQKQASSKIAQLDQKKNACGQKVTFGENMAFVAKTWLWCEIGLVAKESQIQKLRVFLACFFPQGNSMSTFSCRVQ